MKLKQIPEDFIVEEINYFKISKEKTKHRLFLLEKKGWDLFSLLEHLSKENNIPFEEFGFAGMKDKHGITKQYISVPSKYTFKKFEGEDYKLRLKGYIKDKIIRGNLKGNKFEITLRDLKKKDIDKARTRVDILYKNGVPNYYDSQRFGSVINNEFIAKYLIEKDYEKALKTFLCAFSENDSKYMREDKEKISKNWDHDLNNLKIRNPLFRKVLEKLDETNSYIEAYNQIPKDIRLMHISAYQSYIWNECIKEVFLDKIPNKIIKVKYELGELYFFKELTLTELELLPKTFKSVTSHFNGTDYEKDILEKVLDREKLKFEDFDIHEKTGSYFSSYDWNILIKPQKVSFSENKTDELSDKRMYKVSLSFTLPKGSYATIVVKSLFM